MLLCDRSRCRRWLGGGGLASCLRCRMMLLGNAVSRRGFLCCGICRGLKELSCRGSVQMLFRGWW